VLRPGLLQLGLAAVVATALLAGQGGLLQYTFPAAALAVAVVLERRSLTAYLSFVIWLWMLTPFVRRVADHQSGWHEPSLILLAPYAASVWPPARELLVATVRSIRAWPRLEGLGLFVVAAIGAGFGIPLGMLTAPSRAVVETLNWWGPIAFGAYIALRTTDPAAVERALARTLMVSSLFVGLYGIYQFQSPPVWDKEWIVNSEIASVGYASEFELRSFSTTASPAVLAFLMLPAIMLWMARPRLWQIASVAAALGALALSEVRVAWLALLVAACLVLWRVGVRERVAFVACLLFFAVCIAAVELPPQVSEVTSKRFMSLLRPSEDESAVSRATGHTQVFDVILDHPLGIGIGIEEQNLSQVIGARDSLIIAVFVQFGILGATVYLLAMIALLFRLWRYYRDAPTREGMALGATAIGLLSMMLGGNQTAGAVGTLIWIAAGLGTVPVRARRLARHAVQSELSPAKVVTLRPAVAPGGVE